MKLLQYYKKQFIMGCLIWFPALNQAQEAFPAVNGSGWDYSKSRVERSTSGNKIDIILSIVPLVKQKKQEIICISPVYVSADGKDSVLLDPICIAGKKRYKVINRRKALHTLTGDEAGCGKVISFEKLGEIPLLFKKNIPFERWMADGRLVVRERSYGCAECGVRKHEVLALRANIPLFTEKDYVYNFIEPEKVLVKCYEDSFDCKVTFPVARHDLQKQFADNSQELIRLEKFISENLNIKGAILKTVHIKGYASPEGEFDYNRALAQRRTRTLSEYVYCRYPSLKKVPVYIPEGVGEDWEGLRNIIMSSSLPYKEELLSIIDRYRNDVERESAIRKLDDGKIYDTLLKDFYPGLRRTTFSLSFDIRPYTMEELPDIFEMKPDCMSLHEMFLLAEMYASKGKVPVPVYKKAYEQFPGDVVAALNYANALLKYNRDADGALRVLEPIRYDSRALFPMAIAHNMKGDWQQAEQILKEALEKGNIHAKRLSGSIQK